MRLDKPLIDMLSLNSLSDADRPIRLRLSNEKGVVDDLLLVKRISGVETMCGGIEYSLQCVATEAGMPLKQFIANPVELRFVTDAGALRSVCGIVGGVVEGQSDGGLASYQLIVRDAFSLLEQTCNTRIFRHASEVGRRRHFIEGEAMPPVVLPGAPGLWQRIIGDRPGHTKATVWKLVDYDVEPLA